ncbi:MAG TPA: glutamate 5-kinase [Desulfomonilaceae bacterium]|nr:glutamate 5-kinase [Desulfomonilaceae bacterium]
MNHSAIRKEFLSSVRRIVLKLGSSVVTTDQGLDRVILDGIVDDVCRYKALGKEFIIVSSGAVAAGVRRLNLREGARTIPQKQAAASVGQTRLMAAYEEAFGLHGIGVGQMLLTKDDLTHRSRYLNARNTLTTLLAWGVVPIINENDTVVVQEIRFGDNDNLSALVATLADADLLLALTDIEGFMDCDPRTSADACLIPLVEEITPELKSLASDTSSRVGLGGMASKLEAADIVRIAGIPMIIAGGKIPGIVSRTMEAEVCGTLILPAKEKISARKHWIRYNLEAEGELEVDIGAADAITGNGKSLLPIGIIGVRGHFEHGAAVFVCDPEGKKLAKGLVNYSSEELEKIMGRRTVEIDWILGYRSNDEAVHADNLVLLD